MVLIRKTCLSMLACRCTPLLWMRTTKWSYSMPRASVAASQQATSAQQNMQIAGDRAASLTRRHACMTESEWAKMDLWQSPKSSPQIFRFLSAEPLASRAPSEEMSKDRTGSLWPYSARKNFMLSVKYTCRHMNSVTFMLMLRLSQPISGLIM